MNAVVSRQGERSAALFERLCQDCLGRIAWLDRIYCAVCGRGTPCRDCERRGNRSFAYNRSAVSYTDDMKEWLALYKYRGHERLIAIFCEMLLPAYRQLSLLAAQHAELTSRLDNIVWDGVVYVPVSPERAVERGFNQSERLAAELAFRFRLPLLHLLRRNRHSDKMSMKSRRERASAVAQLFSLNRQAVEDWETSLARRRSDARNRGDIRRLLLVDDVYTTGSTAEACAKALQAATDRAIDVYVLTWARS